MRFFLLFHISKSASKATSMSTGRRPIHFSHAARTWECKTHDPSTSEAIDQFHRSLPGYQPTPLVGVDKLAEEIGVKAVYIKDETNRFGLPAFKILGASWGSFRCIIQKLGLPLDSQLDTAKQAAVAHSLGLYAATEGNHGRAVARMAAILGISAQIHVPSTVHPSTVQLIRSEGATVVISEGSYDDAIFEAETASKHGGGLLVQDHAFGDYEHVPQVRSFFHLLCLDTTAILSYGTDQSIFVLFSVDCRWLQDNVS